MTRPLPSSADNATRERARVLVIDDDASVRSLLVAVLKRNYLVMVANDGLSGFSKAKEFPPDIAVIDIQMPGWDGLQTLGAFRKEPSLAHVKTMVLTSDASRDTVLAAVQAGANDYMIKTAFSREEFDRKIARLLERNECAATPAPRNPASSPLRESIPAPAAQPVPKAVTAVPAPDQPHNKPEPDLDSVLMQTAEKMSISTAAEPAQSTPEVSPDLQEVLDAWE